MRREFEIAVLELKHAVDNGRITKEEAQERIMAWKQRLEAADKVAQQEKDEKAKFKRYREAEAELKKMVKEEKTTEEKATQRLRRLRMKLWPSKNEEMDERKVEPDWDQVKKRIESAVESGNLSREDADKYYEGIKKGMEKANQRD